MTYAFWLRFFELVPQKAPKPCTSLCGSVCCSFGFVASICRGPLGGDPLASAKQTWDSRPESRTRRASERMPTRDAAPRPRPVNCMDNAINSSFSLKLSLLQSTTSWLYKSKSFAFMDLLAIAICDKVIPFIFNNLLASFGKICSTRIRDRISRFGAPDPPRPSKPNTEPRAPFITEPQFRDCEPQLPTSGSRIPNAVRIPAESRPPPPNTRTVPRVLCEIGRPVQPGSNARPTQTWCTAPHQSESADACLLLSRSWTSSPVSSVQPPGGQAGMRRRR